MVRRSPALGIAMSNWPESFEPELRPYRIVAVTPGAAAPAVLNACAKLHAGGLISPAKRIGTGKPSLRDLSRIPLMSSWTSRQRRFFVSTLGGSANVKL